MRCAFFPSRCSSGHYENTPRIERFSNISGVKISSQLGSWAATPLGKKGGSDFDKGHLDLNFILIIALNLDV